MNLEKYDNLKVKVIDKSGNVHTGKVIVYTPPQDNEVYEEAIGLDCGVWLDESDIKSISVIE